MDDHLVRKLNEIEAKLDHIKTQVGAVAYISKHQHKDTLCKGFWSILKGSAHYQKVWLAAADYMTPEEIKQTTSIPAGSIGNTLSRMNDKDLLHRAEEGRYVKYRRADATEGIGLEKLVKEALAMPRAKTETMPAHGP